MCVRQLIERCLWSYFIIYDDKEYRPLKEIYRGYGIDIDKKILSIRVKFWSFSIVDNSVIIFVESRCL